MNRREFLSLGAALPLAGLAAGPDMPALTLGFSLYGMKSLALADALRLCRRIGYDAVELAALPGWPGEPARLDRQARRDLRALLQELPLALPALMENCPLDGDDRVHRTQLDRLRAVAELGHELVPDHPPVIETILGGKPDQWDTLRDRFAGRLADWAALAEKERVVLCLKAHRFGAANRPEHVRWLLDRVKSPRLAAVFDWSHFEQRDITLETALRDLLPATRFVHVKDTVVEKGQPRFVLPGEGSTDYGKLLRGLKDGGYKGCVCVEVSGMVFNQKGYDPEAAARRCHQVLSKALPG